MILEDASRRTEHPGGRWAGLFCATCLALTGGGARAAEPASQRTLTITPTLGVQGAFTSNANVAASDKTSDFILRGLLGLDAKLTTSRVTARVVGEASYDAYSRLSELNGWSMVGNGGANLQLIRNTLAIEADGAITNGNVSTFGAPATQRHGVGGRVRLTTYAVGPRLTMTGGDHVDVAAAARFAQVFYRTEDHGSNRALPADDNIVQLVGSVGTGARLRRYELLTTGEFVKDDHGYKTANAVQSVFVGFGPKVRLITRAGYERVSPVGLARISAPIASAGLEFSPNPRSKISVEGGSRYHRATWAAEANLQVSRTVELTGAYSKTIQPGQVAVARSFREFIERSTQLQSADASAGFTFEGNLYGETSLYRSGELRAVYTGATDSVTASGSWANRTFLRSGGRDRTFIGQMAYTRRLRPDLTLTLGTNYARTYESPLYGASKTYGFSSRLAYKINPWTDFDTRFDRTQSRQLFPGGERIAESVVSFSVRRAF
jgi:uncharacterized protein (PEP-CTERM system associated)